MLRAGLRRFSVLLLLVGGVTAVVSLVVGLLAGSGPSRAVSVGLYLVGSFLLVAGFFVGNRGPARTDGADESGAVAGMFGIGVGARKLRWATPEEQEESLANSAVFVVLGFALIVLGILVDSRIHLV